MLWGYSNDLLLQKNDPRAWWLKTLPLSLVVLGVSRLSRQLWLALSHAAVDSWGLRRATVFLSLSLPSVSRRLASGSRTFHVVAEEQALQESKAEAAWFW